MDDCLLLIFKIEIYIYLLIIQNKMDNFIEYSFDSLMQKTKKELHIICGKNNLYR